MTQQQLPEKVKAIVDGEETEVETLKVDDYRWLNDQIADLGNNPYDKLPFKVESPLQIIRIYGDSSVSTTRMREIEIGGRRYVPLHRIRLSGGHGYSGGRYYTDVIEIRQEIQKQITAKDVINNQALLAELRQLPTGDLMKRLIELGLPTHDRLVVLRNLTEQE